jgi:RND family efflux transporter MFP subunit
MKRKYWLLILLLAIALACWGLARAFVPSSAAALVTRGNAVYTVTGSVTVAAESESTIVSPASGIVLADGYKLSEGREVKAGELLARLDPGEIKFLRDGAEIQLNQVTARLDPAKKLPSEIQLAITEQDLANAKPLLNHEPQYYAPADYARLEQTAAQLRAQAETERSELETQRKVLANQLKDYDDQLKRLNINAPYDGIITTVTAHAGDQVDKGGPVAGIISTSVKIQAEVNQDDIDAVKEKQSATVTFFAYPNLKFPALVERILPSSDKETQRFTVLLTIANPSKPLFAGLTGEVNFAAGTHEHALLIPRRALFSNSVIVAKNGRVEVRPVQTGYLTLDQAEITQGVEEGDVVLTENLDLFRTGDRVRLTNNPSAK